MTDLIARLESAQEGSRELSDDVLRACGWKDRSASLDAYAYPAGLWQRPDGIVTDAENRPDPTRSLNDALQLVPEGLRIRMTDYGDVADAMVWQGDTPASRAWLFAAATLPLAVCIARLKFVHQNQGEEVG